MIRSQLHSYTAAILPYSLGATQMQPIVPADANTTEKYLQQALRAATRTGREHFVLLGVGDGILPDALVAALPEAVTLTVAELQPERTRQAMAQGRMQWWRAAGRHRLVADSSMWALLVLMTQAGMTPQNTSMMLHPQLTEQERAACREWQRLFTGVQTVYAHSEVSEESECAHNSCEIPLTVGIIAHPEEPMLENFFAHIPAWVHEVVIVWDAEQLPESAALCSGCPVPVREFARPLLGNFAAQRNAVLAECRTEWVLFLDGDERLSEQGWDALPGMIFLDTGLDVGGYVFPRWTRIGVETRCRAGFGLWPDIQLRLFRIGDQTIFVRKVHEVVQGVPGVVALALTAHIDHYSHVWKDPRVLAERLRVFDEAAGREALHRLSTEYPTVICELYGVLEHACAPGACLLLPGAM